MDVEAVRDLARQLDDAAAGFEAVSSSLSAGLSSVEWEGADAEMARGDWQGRQGPLLTAVGGHLRGAARALHAQADEQTTASEGGIDASAMNAAPLTPTEAPTRAENVQQGEGPAVPGRLGDGSDPDRRDGRRIRDDRVVGREGSGNLSNDWAGRTILERYLTGGDDWWLNDDENWRRYMMENENLRHGFTDSDGTNYVGMDQRNRDSAAEALRLFLSQGLTHQTFDKQFHQAMENGEGIVGYQYLHGTAEPQGDFRHFGSISITPRVDGNYEVTLDANYQWNDRIDPNPQYSTDRGKSLLAEALTLGEADPYDIHISWRASSTLVLNRYGNVVSGTGWPE